MISDKTANLVILVVLVGWSVNLIASVFAFHGYQSNQMVNGLFTLIMTLSFGLRSTAVGKDRGGEHRK